MHAGWSYGKRRNDEKKHHPMLVPYLHLEEHEKANDRANVVTHLRVILGSGYELLSYKDKHERRLKEIRKKIRTATTAVVSANRLRRALGGFRGRGHTQVQRQEEKTVDSSSANAKITKPPRPSATVTRSFPKKSQRMSSISDVVGEVSPLVDNVDLYGMCLMIFFVLCCVLSSPSLHLPV